MEKRLTRKELVEHIKQIMPNDLNEIEKIAFIEKEVAKQISFDEKYLWGDNETKQKIYKLSQREAREQKTHINKKLICVTMAELFGYVAKQFGYNVKYQKRTPGKDIEAGGDEIFEKISTPLLEHVCPLIEISDEIYLEVDIQDDMARLQTNSTPKAFGRNKHGTKIENGVIVGVLDKSVIERTFRKVYNLKEEEMFTEEYIFSLAKEYKKQNKKPIEMFDLFMENPTIIKQFQNTKCVESNKLYKAILLSCYGFSDGEQFVDNENHAIIEECILSEDEGKKRYSFCIYAEDNEQKVFHVYSKKSKKMIKLAQEEIKQMTEQGMRINLKGKTSPIKNNMMEFVNLENKNSNNINSQNLMNSIEEIFVEEDEEEL